MSINLKMERYKVKREIKRSGTYHDIYRPVLNKFGEPTGELNKILTVHALYHEYAPHTLDTYIYLTGEESGTARNKKTPQLYCLFEDIFFKDDETSDEYFHVQVGDICYFGEKKYICTGVRNYQELNIACDISFVGVDDIESGPKTPGKSS